MPKSSKKELEAALRHSAHYLTVLGQSDALHLQGGEAKKKALESFDLEWSNVKAGQRWAEENSTLSDEAVRLCSDYPGYGTYVLSARQHTHGQARWWEKAIEAARRLKDQAAEAAARY